MDEEERKKEELESASEEEKKFPKKKKSKAFLLLILILIVFGGALAGGYYLYGDKILRKGKTESAEETKKPEKTLEEKTGPILTLEPFLINLSGSLQRYAKVSVSVELKDPKTLEYAKKLVPALRDRIIYVLGSKTAETLLDVTGREAIKLEIGERIKGLFHDEKSVKAVYITDIVIQ